MRKTLLPALLLLLTTSAYATKPQVMNGVAVVRNIGENRVAVLLDTNDDKTIDQGFLLSSDLPISRMSARCPEASVEFTDGYVRVTFDKKVYDLYVAGYPEPPAAKHETTRFIGYALMHSTGSSGCNLEGALADAGKCFQYGRD
jgi:hypothetical protein